MRLENPRELAIDMKTFILFIVIFMLGNDSKADCAVELFYVPIGAETYVPIGIDNIENLATHVGCMRPDDKTLHKLLSLVKSAKEADFDFKRVRVKICLSEDDAIFIDNDGGILIDGVQRSVDGKTLGKLKRLVEKIVHEVKSQ